MILQPTLGQFTFWWDGEGILLVGGDLKILDSGIFDKADDKEEGNPFCRNLQNYENKENITKK